MECDRSPENTFTIAIINSNSFLKISFKCSVLSEWTKYEDIKNINKVYVAETWTKGNAKEEEEEEEEKKYSKEIIRYVKTSRDL